MPLLQRLLARLGTYLKVRTLYSTNTPTQAWALPDPYLRSPTHKRIAKCHQNGLWPNRPCMVYESRRAITNIFSGPEAALPYMSAQARTPQAVPSPGAFPAGGIPKGPRKKKPLLKPRSRYVAPAVTGRSRKMFPIKCGFDTSCRKRKLLSTVACARAAARSR